MLKQYTSALQGFQEIINQNPYSYEGLVASWDYAATQLLANGGGGYSSNDETEVLNNDEFNDLDITIDELYGMLDTLKKRDIKITSYSSDNYDQKKFTKKNREIINSNVINAFKDERNRQIEKLNELEKKITTLSESNRKSNGKPNPRTKSDDEALTTAKKEVKTMKVLSEVVKAKKPKNINEHIKIVKADIKKVFGTDKITDNGKTNNIIPTEYNLYQNFPNPFNPNTKINYDLPKDGKVKLVIYDILGREMKLLVNNEFKQAGRYTAEFNGNQFASGIYFYRIQVEGGKSYTAVKKMALIK